MDPDPVSDPGLPRWLMGSRLNGNVGAVTKIGESSRGTGRSIRAKVSGVLVAEDGNPEDRLKGVW